MKRFFGKILYGLIVFLVACAIIAGFVLMNLHQADAKAGAEAVAKVAELNFGAGASQVVEKNTQNELKEGLQSETTTGSDDKAAQDETTSHDKDDTTDNSAREGGDGQTGGDTGDNADNDNDGDQAAGQDDGGADADIDGDGGEDADVDTDGDGTADGEDNDGGEDADVDTDGDGTADGEDNDGDNGQDADGEGDNGDDADSDDPSDDETTAYQYDDFEFNDGEGEKLNPEDVPGYEPTTEEPATEEPTTEEPTTEEKSELTDKERTMQYDYSDDAATYALGNGTYSDEDAYLIACVVSAEDGWSSYKTQVAVANVIMYWASQDGDVRASVFADYRYSVTWNGALLSTFENGPRADAVKATKAALAGKDTRPKPYIYFNCIDMSYLGDDVVGEWIGEEYFYMFE